MSLLFAVSQSKSRFNSDKSGPVAITHQLHNLCRNYFSHTHLFRYSVLYRISVWIT